MTAVRPRLPPHRPAQDGHHVRAAADAGQPQAAPSRRRVLRRRQGAAQPGVRRVGPARPASRGRGRRAHLRCLAGAGRRRQRGRRRGGAHLRRAPVAGDGQAGRDRGARLPRARGARRGDRPRPGSHAGLVLAGGGQEPRRLDLGGVLRRRPGPVQRRRQPRPRVLDPAGPARDPRRVGARRAGRAGARGDRATRWRSVRPAAAAARVGRRFRPCRSGPAGAVGERDRRRGRHRADPAAQPDARRPPATPVRPGDEAHRRPRPRGVDRAGALRPAGARPEVGAGARRRHGRGRTHRRLPRRRGPRRAAARAGRRPAAGRYLRVRAAGQLAARARRAGGGVRDVVVGHPRRRGRGRDRHPGPQRQPAAGGDVPGQAAGARLADRNAVAGRALGALLRRPSG